jgi:hypothetical protein
MQLTMNQSQQGAGCRLFACNACRPAPRLLRWFGLQLDREVLAIRADTLDDAARVAGQHFGPDRIVTVTESS